ncbi:MAG: tyrosine-type recombinase/integrase [Proteobacteria bacterium]|nr:tyrosine-type recombinase/integrase [Pseudomonadota bacterium]
MRGTVDKFLGAQSLGLRSRYTYAGVLRAFEAFVLERESSNRPSLGTLRTWLQQDARRSPLANVVQRVCVIVRYLDWCSPAGERPHVLAHLREKYGRRLNPIVRALLDDDYERALEALRPLRPWGSVLGADMQEHVMRMKGLGYRYEARERDLLRFDRFLQRHPDLARASLQAQLEAWRRESRGVRHQLRVQQCGQILSKARHRKDAATPVLPAEVGLHRRVVQQERRPHLFSEAEIERLLEAARTFPSRNAPLRPIALHAMITLAYCAGLRLGEIASLTLGDLDQENGLLEIRDTKFFKSRRLPLASSTLAVLQNYLEARAATGAPTVPDAPMWWTPLRRCAYAYGQIEKLLVSVMRRAGLKPAHGQRGPRVHDLRHTFVAHRMMQWYREGVDAQTRLPHLSTYLGHKDISSTLVYLNITPELLQQASERHRRRNAGALRASEGRS